jgi:hypothetical protein
MEAEGTNETNEWETVVDHEDYEINVNYPHQIRKKATGNIVVERLNCGYPCLKLNGKDQRKHRLIALQFIPNPDQLPEVDHINHNRVDNRILNLRWVSASDNMFNRGSHMGYQYEFFDELPVPCQPLLNYQGHDLEGYMVSEDHDIYFHNGFKYRKLVRLLMRGRYEYYRLQDIEGRLVSVSVNQIDNWI